MLKHEGYPIKFVSSQTGLSPHVIRVWEKRYKAVLPKRTETNRRLYSQADLEKLQLLGMATKSGHSISSVASLSLDALRQIAPVSGAQTATAGELNQNKEIVYHLQECFRAVEQFETQMLEENLMRASVALSQPELLDGVVGPLMTRIGDLWQAGALRVAHEHAVSGVVRTFLGNVRFSHRAPASAPNAIVATPAGQMHEIGALMAAVTAASEGWTVTFLGANLPAQEIALAAERKQARAILLSIVYPEDDPYLDDELFRIQQLLPAKTVIIAGGRGAAAYFSVLQKMGVTILNDLGGLRRELGKMRR